MNGNSQSKYPPNPRHDGAKHIIGSNVPFSKLGINKYGNNRKQPSTLNKYRCSPNHAAPRIPWIRNAPNDVSSGDYVARKKEEGCPSAEHDWRTEQPQKNTARRQQASQESKFHGMLRSSTGLWQPKRRILPTGHGQFVGTRLFHTVFAILCRLAGLSILSLAACQPAACSGVPALPLRRGCNC